jgi:hypothetical protein
MGINTRYLNAGFLDGGYAYTERKYIYLKEDNQTIFGVSNSNLSIRPFLIKKRHRHSYENSIFSDAENNRFLQMFSILCKPKEI